MPPFFCDRTAWKTKHSKSQPKASFKQYDRIQEVHHGIKIYHFERILYKYHQILLVAGIFGFKNDRPAVTGLLERCFY